AMSILAERISAELSRREMERSRDEARRQLRVLMDNLPGMAYRCFNKPDWPFDYVSGGSRTLTGYGPHELVDGSPLEFGELIHPDDQQMVWDEVQSAIDHQRPFELVYRIHCRDGSQKWVLERGRAVGTDESGVEEIEGFISDITRRVEAEAELRCSLERLDILSQATNDAIRDWDLQRDEIWWSQAYETLFGHLRSAEPLDGESWRSFIHPDERKRVLDEVQAGLDSDASQWSIEYRFGRRDGGYAYVLDRTYIIRDDQGRAIRTVGSMTDLSQRRELEQQLAQAQKLESVGRLAGGIAHDFNNLLTVILSAVDHAHHTLEEDTPLYQSIQDASSATRRAVDLVRQLLTFSRHPPPDVRVVDLRELIGGILSMLERLLDDDIGLVWQPSERPAPVRVDARQIEQVLVNLIVNARDAIDGMGTIIIELDEVTLDEPLARAEPSIDAGAYVVIRVADTGQGISEATIEDIFDPFFTTKGPQEGTGLGLAMAHSIVSQLGGLIRVSSDPGEGATFEVHLPRVDALPDESPDTGPAASAPAPLHHETILLVEDNKLVARAARRVLEPHGYQLLYAADGAEALEVLDGGDQSIDLIITDIVMPVMNGPEFIAALPTRFADVPVIYMSGYSTDEIDEKIVSSAHTTCIEKPFEASNLRDTVRAVIDGASVDSGHLTRFNAGK
ncbi:MAG: PAS domain-containing protein, partial [Persicimonas sp.]